MSHTGKINHSDVPIRLFKSNFMEFFTHISPVTIVIIWLPIAVYALTQAFNSTAVVGSWWYIPVAILIGFILWSLTEYVMHRFVFHFKPKTAMQERISFLFHGVHHAQPQLKTRLVMPLPVSIPLALVFYGLFYLVLAMILKIPYWIAPMFGAFLLGYLAYDITHYATHHFPMRKGYWKFLKRYHNQHHYKAPDRQYGVTSPVWDKVFRTEG